MCQITIKVQNQKNDTNTFLKEGKGKKKSRESKAYLSFIGSRALEGGSPKKTPVRARILSSQQKGCTR